MASRKKQFSEFLESYEEGRTQDKLDLRSKAKDMAMEGYAPNRNFGKFAALHDQKLNR